MPFTIQSTLSVELQAVRKAAALLPDRLHAAQVRIGFYLVSKERQHFQALVKTGTSNGVTWPQPAESTVRRRQALARRGLLANADPERVGVQSGRLAVSFRFVVLGRSVEVFNTAPYANAFNKRRPIFPPALPAPWLAGCELIVQKTLNKEVQP